MKITVFTTCSDPLARQDPFHESLASYRGFADEILIVNGGGELPGPNLWDRVVDHPWPQEFPWEFIGQQFQRGYDASSGDWVVRADLDFIFHQEHGKKIRAALERHRRHPGVSFWKYQFTLVDRYNLKSRLVIAFNKSLIGDRLKLNGGGDLCQPTLDGTDLTEQAVPEASVPFYNYDFMWKTPDVVKKDFGRFARSWRDFSGQARWGGPDDESAFQFFIKMQTDRFAKPNKHVPLEFHPHFVKEKIKAMTEEQFGHSLWGNVKKASYFQEP